MFDGFIVSKVGALGFGQFGAIFLGMLFSACFLMVFRVTGFGGELRFVGFLFRVLPVFACFALILLFFGFILVVAVFLALGNLMRFVECFSLVLVEVRSTDKRVGFGARLCLFVLRFHQAGGERDRLFIAEGRNSIAGRFSRGIFRVIEFRNGFRGLFFRGSFRRSRCGFRFFVR